MGIVTEILKLKTRLVPMFGSNLYLDPLEVFLLSNESVNLPWCYKDSIACPGRPGNLVKMVDRLFLQENTSWRGCYYPMYSLMDFFRDKFNSSLTFPGRTLKTDGKRV